jgi:MFS family permease
VPLFARVPESRGPSVRVDVVGLSLITAAAFGVVWGLVRGNAAGWTSPETLASIGVGMVAAGVFVAWERRTALPMLPPRLFRSRAFTSSGLAIFLVNGAITGAVFFTAQFFQVVDGERPLAAGLRLLPWGIAPLLLAPAAGALSDRIGVRPLMIAGLVVETVGLAWLAAAASPTAGYGALVGPIAASGAGLAIAIPAITKCVVSAVPLADVGKASGTYATMRQLGGAFGVAILAAVFARTGGYESARTFSDGFAPALAVAAGLAGAGVVASVAVPRLRPGVTTARQPAPAAEAAPVDRRPMAEGMEKV